ncbi:MAG: YdeI/OmpD-associated family protein [Spartobacteria bacterium]
MELGKTLYVTDRKQWRAWLKANHATAKEIWLIYYKKHTAKPRIPYDDAVEEALCYGWIDSTVMRMDEERTAQRYSPRRPRSFLSETNKERVRRLVKSKKMTRAGLAIIQTQLDETFTAAADIVAELKKDAKTWKNFKGFSETYRRIRIGWIDAARHRPEIFQQRLRYLLKMTAQNKKFGMVQ